MKFGFCSFYAYRPHVEHLYFISKVLKRDGNDVVFFQCSGGLEQCYTKNLKNKNKFECAKCIAGGLKSYDPNICWLNKDIKETLSDKDLDDISRNSIYSVERLEDYNDFHSKEIDQKVEDYRKSVEIVYANAKKWITEKKIEALFVFNGRMDHTKAFCKAANELGIPFLTVERTWFGNGLMINYNANCLSFQELKRLHNVFKEKPLTKEQAYLAASLMSGRFNENKVSKEWQVYNENKTNLKWPIQKYSKKVLIIPSSRYEFEGHPEFGSLWKNYTDGFETVLRSLNIDFSDCILRCHPGWTKKLGKNTGKNSIEFYRKWAEKKQIYLIPSESNADTQYLMRQADLIIVNRSSAAFEAALLGKPVISVGHANFEDADFVFSVKNSAEAQRLSWELVDSIDREKIVRSCLRFIYSFACRFGIWFDEVKSISSTSYVYNEAASPEIIYKILNDKQLYFNDEEYDISDNDECIVVKDIINGNWEKYNLNKDQEQGFVHLKRRPLYRWIDKFRSLFAKGFE